VYIPSISAAKSGSGWPGLKLYEQVHGYQGGRDREVLMRGLNR